MPAVSVIVPNYNHAKFLRRRLESILDQTFQDFELIFLDDASTDHSKEVFAQYADDSRISAHFNEINSGSPFIQWNRGFGLATGKYVWLAESDDFSDPEFLETLVSVLEDNPSAGLAFCQSRYVDEEDRPQEVFPYGLYEDRHRWNSDFEVNGISELKDYFSISNVIPNASAVLIRRSVIQSGVAAPGHMKLAGDWMFWCRVLSVSDLCYVSRPLNYFRKMHGSSQRSRSLDDGAELLEGLKVLDFILESVPLEEHEKQAVVSRRLRHWMFAHRDRKFSREVNRRIISEFHRIRYSGSDMSSLHAWLNVGSRALLYYVIQLPVLKKTLSPFWYWIRGNHPSRDAGE